MTDMNDLEWLARRVHKWPAYDPNHNLRLHKAEALNAEGWTFARCYNCGYSFDQWQAERTRLQNKPSWEDAPAVAYWLCQDCDGLWKFSDTQPNYADAKRYWTSALLWPMEDGEVLGDWRDTLERRPETVNPEVQSADVVLPMFNQELANAAVLFCQEIGAQWNYDKRKWYKPDTNANTSAHVNTSAGMKFDDEKPKFDLIPPNAERLLADVLTFGAKKYAPDNWRKVDNADTRYIAAAMRHINAHRSGEQRDAETGLPHLAHAMCCLAFILELEARHEQTETP